VLSRADGVVFVADSRGSQAISNFESFDNLEKNAGRVGLDFETLPLVIQFNKRDLEDIVPEEAVRIRWAPTGLPVVFSSALKGMGVVETFRQLLLDTYIHLDGIYDLDRRYGLQAGHFADLLPAVREP